MTGLAEVVREEVGRSSIDVLSFLQEMVRNGKLRPYEIEQDRETVVRETKREIITRTAKGINLVPVTEIRHRGTYVLKEPDTGAQYFVHCGSTDLCGDDLCSDTHHLVELLRLRPRFNPQRILFYRRGKYVPQENVVARLEMRYVEDAGGRPIRAHYAPNASITGRKDRLLNLVYRHIKGQ